MKLFILNSRIYNIMIERQDEQTLFEDPHQLMTIRHHLATLIVTEQTAATSLLEQLNSRLSSILDSSRNEAFEAQAESLTILQELREVCNEESANMSALSHLTIKMIDYIREKQQQFEAEIENYEHTLDCLRGQLEQLTSKNITIQGDVEMFREQLIAAQTELEEITEAEGGSIDEQSVERDEEVRERRMWELQRELQKIRQQLQLYKFQTMAKRSEVTLNQKTLTQNRSQKFIFPHQTNPNPNVSEPSRALEHEVLILRKRVQQLLHENEQLRDKNQQRSMKRRQSSAFTQSNKKQLPHNLSSLELKQNFTQKMLPHITSISNFQISQKVCPFEPNETRYLIPQKSVEKFHTLSSDVSSKSFQLHLNQYNRDTHMATLIYLGDQNEKIESYQIEKTRETQNSMPHIASEVVSKTYSTLGVNTDREQKDNEKPTNECLCCTVKKSWVSAVDYFFSLRDLAVSKRVSQRLQKHGKL